MTRKWCTEDTLDGLPLPRWLFIYEQSSDEVKAVMLERNPGAARKLAKALIHNMKALDHWQMDPSPFLDGSDLRTDLHAQLVERWLTLNDDELGSGLNDARGWHTIYANIIAAILKERAGRNAV